MALAPRAGRKPNNETHSLAEDRHADQERRRDSALLRDFDALVKQYDKPLFNFVYRFLGDYDEAADIVVLTFTSAWQARDTFRGEAKLNTWLHRIAQNHCKNRVKQRGRQSEMEGPSLDAGTSGDDDGATTRDIADWSGSPAKLLEQKELDALIGKAVDGLAPEYKGVLLLRVMESLSYAEIAQATGLTIEAVKTRLNRARAMVRQRVEPYLSP